MRWIALLAAAITATAQDLPPSVLLLARIKTHVRQEMKRLPDYTCLETVRRFRIRPSGAVTPFDTVRLEILFSRQHEMYSSPGAGAFTDEHPMAFAGSGAMADGMFGTFVQNIFVADAAMFTHRGEEDLAGRRVVKYDFRIPLLMSAYRVNVSGGSGTVGMKGSFWADPVSFDLVRLEVHADEIPTTLPIEDIIDVMNFSRVQVGERSIMLAETADLRVKRLDGDDSRNLIDLTHCRTFGAESTIKVDSDAIAAAVLGTRPSGPAGRTGESVGSAPGGLLVTVRLRAPITEKSTVGSLIEGVVEGDVKSKAGVVVPGGAVVHGRIRRLERNADAGEHYLVGIEFMDIEIPGGRLRFFAELQSVEGAAGAARLVSTSSTKTTAMQGGGSSSLTTTQVVWATDLPGVGSFFVKGSAFELPAGVRMVWKTTDLPK